MDAVKFNELRNLLMADRTVRRFEQSRSIAMETLRSIVELARYCHSGRNAQPLRYRIVNDAETCAAIFPSLAWAGYYTDWDGPEEGERPAAYLVQCLDTRFGADCLCDDGLQLEAISLGAAALGLRGCIIKAFNINKVQEALNLPANLKPRYVLALGYPAEEVRIVDMDGSPDASFRYFHDGDGVHTVPKRTLDELIV